MYSMPSSYTQSHNDEAGQLKDDGRALVVGEVVFGAGW